MKTEEFKLISETLKNYEKGASKIPGFFTAFDVVVGMGCDLIKEIEALREKMVLAREFIYEVSLPPFKDSDSESLLKTLRSNAKKFIKTTNNLT